MSAVPPSESRKPAVKGRSRFQRTVRSLLLIGMLGVVLAAYSSVTQIRDVGLATGATGPDQRAFFIAAADRPDIAVFFKGLKPQERLKMARQLGEYDDPKIAVVIAKLLGDFDVEARKVLTASLTRLARTQPAAVAEQLKEKGSFQQYGVSEALRSQGESVLPAVVTTLANGDARPNAVAYLVAAGPPAIPLLVPKLDDANKDVVLAAADALGKLRARAASPRLVALYRAALPDDRTSYLTALAGLGDPATEPIFQSIAQSDREPNPIRAQAALGLGRIGSTTAVATLWKLVDLPSRDLRTAAISGLQLAGDAALAGNRPPSVALAEVASRVRTARGIDTLRRVLTSPLARSAEASRVLEQCHDQPALVPTLMDVLDTARDGEPLDALVRALLTTRDGAQALESVARSRPDVAAWRDRNLRVAR